MQPCVSMVMPCYNKEQYIDGMLNSVGGQLWDNIELIMLNDGSTDGTRRVIESRIPLLEKRGYSVILLDQDNNGVADSVKNGLEHVTGSYVCCVDCDDKLHPEYVSKMVLYLIEHPECDFVSCEFEILRMMRNGKIVDDVPLYASQPFSEHFLEDFLLRRCGSMVWRYLVRTDYLKACRVREHFFTKKMLNAAKSLRPAIEEVRLKDEVFINQEPSFVIPLAAGGGHGVCLPDKLYTHNQLDAGNNVFRRVESDTYMYITEYIYKHVVNSVPLFADKRERMRYILDLSAIRHRYCCTDLMRDKNAPYLRKCAIDATEWASRAFVPDPRIDSELILKTGYRVFFQAVENKIFNHRASMPIFPEKGRVIGLGACGNIAKELVPALQGTKLECDLLWDGDMQKEYRQGNCLITNMDFDKLTPNDIVLSLTKRERLHKFITAQISDKPFVRYLPFFELLDFLANHYYADLRNCRFAPESAGTAGACYDH